MKRRAELRVDESASTSRENSEVPKDSARKDKGQPLIKIVKVLDGSFETEIKRYIPMYSFREIYMYNLEDHYEPTIRQVHENFLNAGANIIRTNTTYAYPSLIYVEDQYSEETYKKIIRNAVEIANKAVNIHNKKSNRWWKLALVFGSCGCFDSPTEMTEHQIKNEYRCLIKALSDAGVVWFCLQDIQRSQEANLFVELLKEFQKKDTKALMMFKPHNLGKFLKDGTDWIDTAVDCYNKISLMAVGVNCMTPLASLIEVQRFRKIQKQIPLVVCSRNVVPGRIWRPVGLANTLPSLWADLKIDFLGGCCNVESSSIKYIRDNLKLYSNISLET